MKKNCCNQIQYRCEGISCKQGHINVGQYRGWHVTLLRTLLSVSLFTERQSLEHFSENSPHFFYKIGIRQWRLICKHLENSVNWRRKYVQIGQRGSLIINYPKVYVAGIYWMKAFHNQKRPHAAGPAFRKDVIEVGDI